MRLEDSKIYPFVKDRPGIYSRRTVEAGEPIALSVIDGAAVWFLLEGVVEATATTYNGQVVRLEFIYENDFVGELSRSWGEVFNGDCFAYTRCELIRIPGRVFSRMLEEDIELRDFFQRRCLKRIYGMYKEVLATRIFSQRQLFAAQIIRQADGADSLVIDFPSTCYYVNATRRNIYNLIKAFDELGLVTFERGKPLVIRNLDGLKEIASPVLEFMDNKG